jgi:hypothetical protein
MSGDRSVGCTLVGVCCCVFLLASSQYVTLSSNRCRHFAEFSRHNCHQSLFQVLFDSLALFPCRDQ